MGRKFEIKMPDVNFGVVNTKGIESLLSSDVKLIDVDDVQDMILGVEGDDQDIIDVEDNIDSE